MTASFTLKKLTDVEDAGPAPEHELRFATEALGLQDAGISHHRFAAGHRQPFGHRHDKAEEVYVVLSGSGRVKLDDEIVEIGARDAFRVAPPVIRAFEAGPEGLELIACGARHKGDGELINDWWID